MQTGMMQPSAVTRMLSKTRDNTPVEMYMLCRPRHEQLRLRDFGQTHGAKCTSRIVAIRRKMRSGTLREHGELGCESSRSTVTQVTLRGPGRRIMQSTTGRAWNTSARDANAEMKTL